MVLPSSLAKETEKTILRKGKNKQKTTFREIHNGRKHFKLNLFLIASKAVNPSSSKRSIIAF